MSRLSLHRDYLADIRASGLSDECGDKAAAKPYIVEVVSRYTDLKRQGKELVGLCPIRSEKTPSFTVNADKGVFYCHGCHEGGDVISFIQKIEGLSFREALLQLGIRRDQIPRPQNDAVKRLAAAVCAWANQQFDKAQNLLREIGRRARLDHVLGWPEEIRRLSREWQILSVLADDLQTPQCVIFLWEAREIVENLLQDVEPEPLPTFPPLTDRYRATLQAYVRGEA